MRPHPYLRAYMAGIVVPTMFLLILVTVFAFFRFYVLPPLDPSTAPTLGETLGLERLGRAMIFPMAVVPNLWGLWNMLYLALQRRRAIPLGAYGALLPPLVLVPAGIALDQLFDVVTIRAGVLIPFVAVAMIAYFLVWKYIVGFLNHEMGIA